MRISVTRCPIEMGLDQDIAFKNGQVIYIEKSKLNIADMWLIPLDRAYLLHSKWKLQIGVLKTK